MDGRLQVFTGNGNPALAEAIMSHRLLLTAEAEFAGVQTVDVISQVLAEVAPPTERVA